jgi:nitric oxide reductase NorE protein
VTERTVLPDFLWGDAPTVRSRQRERVRGVPGEVGLWVFIFGDMTVFGAMLITFMAESRRDRPVFEASSSSLHQPLGATNTMLLLASSLLVVLAGRAHRAQDAQTAGRLLTGALLCAGSFVALKAVEYSLEVSGGHDPSTNLFFTFYFVLTGLHLVHVLIGAGLLLAWRTKARRQRSWLESGAFVESASSYWHMVDLLWIAIYTLLYLVSVS